MGEAAIDPAIIKRTQDTLGQIISAPALTEKLLSRPPVQFLQDIVKAVVKKTNFLQGLYSDEELSSAYLKESRDNKTLFMKKLVTAVYIAVKRPPEVRVSKILAGQEADKTNLLLQTLAEAISANVDSNDVVRKALQSLGEGNENEEPARPSERSRERRESEQTEKPSASTSGDRVRTAKADRAPKSTENEEAPSDKRGSSREASREQAEREASSHQKRRRSSRPNDDAGNATTGEEKRSSTAAQKPDDDEENERKDDDDSSRRRPSRPSSAKGPRKQQNNSNQQRAASPKADPPSRPPATQPTSMSMDRDNSDERPLVRPGTASAAKSRKPMKANASDDIAGSSARVASAAQRGQGTLIVESKDDHDNDVNDDHDDDDNFLIQEEKPSASKSFKQDDLDNRDGEAGDQDENDGDQHGALVKKMIETKKGVGGGSELAGQRSDVKTIAQNDAQRRREREKIQKDVDKLRETIQSLTKSVVPLGKILEYLQEDYEMMAREMQHYTDDYKRTVVELRKEKFATDQTLEPLRAAMMDFDDQIVDMKSRIIFMKKKISGNEKANATRLLDIIRKTK